MREPLTKTFLLSAALLLASCVAAFAQAPKPCDTCQDRRDIRSDTRDIHRDRRDLRSDRHDRRADFRDLRHDRRGR
jgi:hypothetical protein